MRPQNRTRSQKPDDLCRKPGCEEFFQYGQSWDIRRRFFGRRSSGRGGRTSSTSTMIDLMLDDKHESVRHYIAQYPEPSKSSASCHCKRRWQERTKADHANLDIYSSLLFDKEPYDKLSSMSEDKIALEMIQSTKPLSRTATAPPIKPTNKTAQENSAVRNLRLVLINLVLTPTTASGTSSFRINQHPRNYFNLASY